MEENIKIIEEMIEVYRSCVPEEDFDMRVDIGFMKEEVRALENLLTRYKQLEEENKHYKKYAVMMTTEGLLINGVKFSFNDYIPKSKVKEKIEYYDKEIKKIENKKIWNEPCDTIIRNRFVNYFNALKELLES